MSKRAEVWGFWAYDLFPYVLGGRVVERAVHYPNGAFFIVGYGNCTMNPTVFVNGDAGKKLADQLKVLTEANRRQRAMVERRMCKAVAACFKAAKAKHPKPENLK